MANYVIKEMPAGMGNGKKGRTFPKMQIYTEFDYEKVVELIHTNSPAFSQATIRGVLDTLGVVLKNYLPMGHTMKIDNLGVFSLALEFADEKAENVAQQEIKGDESKTKYHHVKVKGVNFKVDKKLIKAINKENTFERTSSNVVSRSPAHRAMPHPAHLTPQKSVYSALCNISTSMASSLSKTTPTSTASVAAKPPGNSPNLSAIPHQASKQKAPARIKSG